MSVEPIQLERMRPRLAEAVDYALLQGLLKRNPEGGLVHAPFALNPSPIDPESHRRLEALTAPFNRMAHAVARDTDFLREALAPAARVDEFTRTLLGGMGERDAVQPLHLQITRSDYFLHRPPEAEMARPSVRQVELNLISASYAGLSEPVNRLHRYLLRDTSDAARLVANGPIAAIADAIAEAVRHYGAPDAQVLAIVQAGETNVFDQRLLEFALREQGVITRRATLDEVGAHGRLREGHLTLGGGIMAVAYFRAGYGPEDYRTPAALRGRELIEASSAIAVPTLATQLAGTKKLQQTLTDGAVLRRFCDEGAASLLESAFAAMHDLEQPLPTPHGEMPAWQAALEAPQGYVLKPQREGGGHNRFGEEMCAALRDMAPGERPAYILMELLRPATHPALLVREGEMVQTEAVSEIGRFGVYLAQHETVLRNADVGYLVRTKGLGTMEGGISAGFGFLDSLLLDDRA